MAGRYAVRSEFTKPNPSVYVVRDNYGRGEEFGRFVSKSSDAADDEVACEAADALAESLNKTIAK